MKILELIGYCEYTENTEFVYTPLSYEGYGVNFGSNELKAFSPFEIKNHREAYLEVCRRWDDMLGFKGLKITDEPNVSFVVHPPGTHPINPNTEEVYRNVYKQKNKIKERLSLPPKVKKDYLDIVIHIRRADVGGPGGSYASRWADDNYYLDILDKIKSIGIEHKITIYTQRKNFNSTLFSDYDIVYDDETVDSEIWLNMVHSDVLVMGKSSYSQSAGFLSDGLCVYPSDIGEHLSVKGRTKVENEWVSSDNIIESIKTRYEKSVNNGN